MREDPPAELLDLLARLKLAPATQVKSMWGRVKRLASDLPPFQSVWVDALSQARVLTAFQAAEINAGRGEQLAVGPYVLSHPAVRMGYADVFAARAIDTEKNVRLLVAPSKGPEGPVAEKRLVELIAKSASISSNYLPHPIATGCDQGRVWMACARAEGRTATEWLVENGRLPPQVVLEIARQMAAALAIVEKLGIQHGDISAAGLLLRATGEISLPHFGVRGILRPAEGYGSLELSPESYDYLAPERVAAGTPPTVASDLFACGCLWWQLLTGRTALAGGDALSKVRSAHAGKIVDVLRFAPDTPGPLAAAIRTCTDHDPRRRPASFADLAAALGPPTKNGGQLLAKMLSRQEPTQVRLAYAARLVGHSRQTPIWATTLAGCLVALALLAWPALRSHDQTAVKGSKPQLPAAPAGRSSAARLGTHTSDDEPRHTTLGMAARQVASESERLVRVLPAKSAARLAQLDLEDGAVLRAASAERATIVAEPEGVQITGENLHFENIDFIAGQASRGTILHLQASRVKFINCSFSSEDSGAAPVAIRWIGPQGAPEQPLQPSGRLLLHNCLLTNIAGAVHADLAAPALVEVRETLHLGSGPLLMYARSDRLNEAVALWMTHSTVRGSASVVHCRYEAMTAEPAPVSINAKECVFFPGAAGSLLTFEGHHDPSNYLVAVDWSGQGSLLAGTRPVAVWLDGGRPRSLDDQELTIGGIVRGQVSFSGKVEDGPQASQAVRWQAPLQSADPPGIRTTLPVVPQVTDRAAEAAKARPLRQ